MTKDYDAHLRATYGDDLDGENQPENQEDTMLTHEHTPNAEDCTVCWPDTEPPVSRDRYTVSGNSLRMWRLDSEGTPVGDPIEWPGKVQFDISADEVEDVRFDVPTDTFTIDMKIADMGPDLMALFYGGPLPEPKRLPWWQRLLNWWWTR